VNKRVAIVLLLALAAVWCGVVVHEHALPRGQFYNGKYLSDWVRGLLSNRPEVSAATESQIRQMGTNALPLLVRLQQYTHQSKYWYNKSDLINWVNKSQSLVHLSNPEDRLGAKLFDLCPPLEIRAVPLLIDLLAEDDRGYASGLLISADTNAGPLLVKALSNKNPMVRQRALHVIEVLGYTDDSLLPALRTCLKDENEEIRVRVAIKLLRTRSDDAMALTVLSNAFNGNNKRYWKDTAHYVKVKFPQIASQAGLP
jgi:hypothetical protein